MRKISIITVNYNNKHGLEKTIQSVICQKCNDFEFIVVDGGSNDGSSDIIEKYKNDIDISIIEKDHGVYDAMNKGIQASSGEWINFMNSGDIFCDNNTLHNVFRHDIPSNTRIIYGNQRKIDIIVPPLPITFLKFGIIHACHQAMFFRKGILYNLEYKIYADYDLVARTYNNDMNSLLYIDETVCEFEGEGLSSKISPVKRKDKYRSIFRIFGFRYVIASFLYMLASKLVS